jgi:hypothetical protein
LIENLQVSDVGLQLTTVPYTELPVLHECIVTELSELKPVPVIVTVTSPVLDPFAGETLVIVGEAALGILTTNSRSRRPRPIKSGNRFMPVLFY